LTTTRLRDLRVAEIARDAGTSPATFYVYFPDVSDAVLAAIEETSQSLPELLALADDEWADGDPVKRASSIVRGYVDHWAAHNALFRVRNLAADEGDMRFMAARAEATKELLQAFARAADRAEANGWLPAGTSGSATAGVVMAMLERVAAVQFYYNSDTLHRDAMIHSAALMISRMFAPLVP
jgi:AcrR family transcriptional regulator